MTQFTSHTLHREPWGGRVSHILSAAIQAVEPGAAVRRHLQRLGERLFIGDIVYDLGRYRRVWLVGAGKAGEPMALSAARVLGERLSGGVVVVKEGYAQANPDELPRGLQILEAGHPLPDERGVQATRRMAELLADAYEEDLVICLISGGGSALLVSPAAGLTLADLQNLTSELLSCGANIHEINTLRKHLEQLKGGGLARLATPASLAALILSDVIGNPLEVIASGPTVPDLSTFADAYHILDRYGLLDRVPRAVVKRLELGQSGQISETPKPGDPSFDRVQNVVVGDNLQAAQAALEKASSERFHTMLLTTYLQGEARHAGRALAAIARQIAATGQPLPRPCCLVAGGETTVTIQGDGLGGRNQELALGAVTDLAGLRDVALVTLATDGGDGPTDAAGAIVSGETLERARQTGKQPEEYLARNDAYNFFDALDDLIKIGPTQTNVNDLAFLFAFEDH